MRDDARRPRVLLTVSGTIPTDLDRAVADGRRPRADHRVLCREMDADHVDVAEALRQTGWTGRILHRLGGAGPLLAWYTFRNRQRYDAVVTDGEQVGIPLAALMRLTRAPRPHHLMIVHVLSTRSKRAVMRLVGAAAMIDRYLVYASAQQRFVVEQLGVPPDRVVLSTFMVDTAFFAPGDASEEPSEPTTRPVICAAGLERRDYPTMMEAVDGLDADVVIAAASPWSRQPDSSAARPVPANVEIQRLDLHALRALYDRADVVVMPLVDVDFQAGITAILEAMAMAKPVVCTRTDGQTDTIRDRETGVYVPPGDAAALRTAIKDLLDDPAEAERLGRNARDWVVEHADVDRYADAVAAAVASMSPSRTPD